MSALPVVCVVGPSRGLAADVALLAAMGKGREEGRWIASSSQHTRIARARAVEQHV